MADAHTPDPDDEPVLDIRPLSDVVPLDDVYVIGEPVPDRPRAPRAPVGRPVVGGTLTGVGVAGTAVAALLPWSAGQSLPGLHSLVAGRTWLVWLLVTAAAAEVLGVLALLRPGRRLRWWGAVVAAGGAALSGWAVLALPADQPVGVGPGLACATLFVLVVGQLCAALTRTQRRRGRWRPALVAAAVVVVMLAAAGYGSARFVVARDVAATTAVGPLPAVTGTAPSVVDRKVWGTTARVYDVAGSVALVVGGTQRDGATLSGVSVLDLRTGAQRWHHYERGWSVREAALTADGTTAFVVLDTASGTEAVGFDVAAGTIRWRQRLATGVDCVAPRPDRITPVGACAGQFTTGDGLLFVDGAGHVTYLAARDGRSWPVSLGGGCRVRGAGADGVGVYVLDQCVSAGFPEPHLIGERVIAYDLDGRRRWTRALDAVRGTVAGGLGPVFVRGDVVLAEQEQSYVALSTATGAELWNTTDGFEPATTATDGAHLVWSIGTEILGLDLHSGVLLWRRSWQFPEEADLTGVADGHVYVLRRTVGPNPYTCAEHAVLLTLVPASGAAAGPPSSLPAGAGDDCGPNVQDRGFLRGSLVVLVTANTITVLTGR
jgi:outer membrane protein assembly factor BamB